MGTAMAIPHYDWLSPGGVATVHHTTWYPTTYYSTWYYPAPYYAWYTPVVYNYIDPYNYFDPWWAANVYGPVRTTYYWGW